MTAENPDYILAHDNSSNHIDEIMESETCGCFYCLEIFKPNKIKEWIDNKETALCPKCGIDSVIGSKSNYPITKDFLQKMHEYWFKHGREITFKNGKIISDKEC